MGIHVRHRGPDTRGSTGLPIHRRVVLGGRHCSPSAPRSRDHAPPGDVASRTSDLGAAGDGAGDSGRARGVGLRRPARPEWIGVEAAPEWLLELIDEPPRGTRVTVVPVVNPDGRARVEADLLAGRNTYRRGNRNHVDLNRDFSAHRNESTAWQALLPRRYSTSPGPLSQPETRALEALADTIDFDVVISLHAFGGYLYHPWAGRWQRPEDWAAYVAAGRRMEEAQTAHAYRTRQLSRWGFFFRALGTELDHFAAVHGSQSWLIETTRSGWDPRRPFASVRTYFRWYNPRTPSPHSARVVAALRTFLPTESAPVRGHATD